MGATGSREPCCASGITPGPGRAPPVVLEPIRVAIAGGGGQVGYALLPLIAAGGMFGHAQPVIIQCLDLDLQATRESMRGMEMEMQDGNFHLLHKALFTTDESVAFKNADYAILLGSFPHQDGKDKREIMEKNVLIFRTMGRAIQEHANRGCKVLVVGRPANTNALICSQYAPLMPKESFFALTRLEQNRAAGFIAQRAGVRASEVRNVIAWGGHTRCLDVDTCTVQGTPVLEVLTKEEDRTWLQEQLVQDVQERGRIIYDARKASSAISTARAICDTLHDLHAGTRSGEHVSLGVWTDGREYGVGAGLYFSMPVLCYGRGRYRVTPGLVLGAAVQAKIREVETDLQLEKELAKEIFARHAPSPTG